MFQRVDQLVAYKVPTYPEALSLDGLGDRWSRAKHASRTRAATLVLGFLCSVVSFLSIDPVADRDLLLEQYDFKLWSQRDRLLVFCLSVVPSLIGMATVLVAYKAIKIFISIF